MALGQRYRHQLQVYITGTPTATSDQSTGIKWYKGTYQLTNATGTAIGTRTGNTNLVISSQGEVATSYAAGLARAFTGGGYSNWYLPSRDEMNKFYLNKVAVGGFAILLLEFYLDR